MVQVTELLLAPLRLALQLLHQITGNIITQHGSDLEMRVSSSVAQFPNLVSQGHRVQSASICDDLDLLFDNDVDALFELVEEPNLIAQAWITSLGDGIPGNVHLRQPVASDDIHIAPLGHTKHRMRRI